LVAGRLQPKRLARSILQIIYFMLELFGGKTLMKPRLPAGDTGDDRKAIRKELIEAKAMLGKLIDARTDKILKKPRKELPTSVPALQGGRPESNRRKF